MQIRRFTRLTNAFSKKSENHRAALALFFAFYNFCRVHMTLKETPAMAPEDDGKVPPPRPPDQHLGQPVFATP
jgi:hypothetical protein